MTEVPEPCWAGRKAFNKGNPTWRMPCMRSMEPTHVVVITDDPGAPTILLCTFHYEDVLAQGLIEDPEPTEDEIERWRSFRPEIFGPVE